MRARLRALALAGMVGLSPLPGFAQVTWDPINWNPVELPGDVTLPMRCGAAMVFRRVDTSVTDNWLSDAEMQLGNTDVAGQEHSESVVVEGLAGGLSNEGAAKRYYLIGKYEVTADQYAAVMSDVCPTPSDDGSRPAEGMNWLDAQVFAARYNTWLYENARDAVEDAAGPGAFVRLPTEAEWEFAARGGIAVTEAERRKRLYEMDGPLTGHVWFSGFKSCDGITQPIGLLSPNPLGLFDILGNVQEYTTDYYRLRRRERAHGQVGGIVARGGSCLTQENRVRVSDRDEIVPYDLDTGAPAGKVFTGLRMVFGSPVLESEGRISAINENWFDLGEGRVEIDPADDPITTLGVIAEAEDDAAVQTALLNARDLFLREMERRNVIETESAKAILQGGFLAARTYIVSYDEVSRWRTILTDAPAETPADDVRAAREALARSEERLDITADVLLNSIVQSAESFEVATVEAALEIVREEFRLRQAAMSERTALNTQEILGLFHAFVSRYRTASDTDPQVFFEALAEFHAELISRQQ